MPLTRLQCVACLALFGASCSTQHEVRGSRQPTVLAPVELPSVQRVARDACDLQTAPMQFSVYLPPGYDRASGQRYPVLYLNDGQDSAAMGLPRTLAELRAAHAIKPAIVVAIDMPKDRMATYGLSDPVLGRSLTGHSRVGPIGTDAHAYSEWVTRQLVPYMDSHYRTQASASGRTVLGGSLGGLNAFNLGWQYPGRFAQAGAFSPSFWLSAASGDVQPVRLAQAMVESTRPPEDLRLWLAVGTEEETDDRDGDGLNDALDDVLDVVDALGARGLAIERGEAAGP